MHFLEQKQEASNKGIITSKDATNVAPGRTTRNKVRYERNKLRSSPKVSTEIGASTGFAPGIAEHLNLHVHGLARRTRAQLELQTGKTSANRDQPS